MKKSQLRKIIRESIKQLMNEVSVGDGCECPSTDMTSVYDPPYTGNETGAVSMGSNGTLHCDCRNNKIANDTLQTKGRTKSVTLPPLRPNNNDKISRK